jgi:hypothetical protein
MIMLFMNVERFHSQLPWDEANEADEAEKLADVSIDYDRE